MFQEWKFGICVIECQCIYIGKQKEQEQED